MRSKGFIYIIAAVDILLSLAVLIGWHLDIPVFKSLHVGWAAMKYNTALAFLFVGITLLGSTKVSDNFSLKAWANIPALAVLAIGGVNVIQYLAQIDLGIDELLVRDLYSQKIGLVYAGRMSGATATCITVLGLALLSLNLENDPMHKIMQMILHLVTFTGLLAMLGYMYGIPILHKLSGISSMALHTAILFVLNSIAITLFKPKLGLNALFLGQGTGNTMARLLFPAATITLVILGYLRIELHKLGLVSVEFGIALFTISFLIIILILVIITAGILNKIDNQRLLIEESYLKLNRSLEQKVLERTAQLGETKERFEIATHSAEIGVWEITLHDGLIYGNDYFYKLNGLEGMQAISDHTLMTHVHPMDQVLFMNEFALVATKQKAFNFKYRVVLPDQSIRHIKILCKLPTEKHSQKIYGVCIDITKQIKFEEELNFRYKRFKTFIAEAPTSIAMLDTHYKILAVSNQWLKDFCQHTPIIKGEHIKDILPDFFELFEAAFNSCLKGKVTLNEGIRFLDKNREEFWFKYTVSPWYISEYEIGGIIINTIDITEQKRRELELIHTQERLQLATEAAKVGVWDLDLVNDILLWDDQMYKIYGREPSYDGDPRAIWKSVVHPEEMDNVMAEIQEAIKYRQEFDTSFRIFLPDDSLKHIKVRGIVQKDDNGQPLRVVGTQMDVTQDFLFLETLSQSEERYFKMVNEVQDYAIVMVTIEGKIENWNYGAEKIFEYSYDEIFGAPISKVFSEDDINGNKVEILFNQAFDYGRAQDEGWKVRRDGSLFYSNTTVTALHGINEKLIGYSVLIHDLTERKKAELAEKMEAKNKELEQITYIASHDLQEPLRTISGIINIMNEYYAGKLDDDADRYLKFMKEASERMKNLIKGLLDYSRLGKGNELQAFDTEEILKEITDDLATYIKENDAIIDTLGKLPKIKGYKTEFRLLLQNLIGNGIKFKKKDQIPILKISVVKERNFWKFAISDNGIGIDLKYQEKIFMIFQRLHNRNEYEGTGIGLSHCKKIVELHGGKIWVNSAPEEGSTFFFTIPL